jgi:hypothetical protein
VGAAANDGPEMDGGPMSGPVVKGKPDVRDETAALADAAKEDTVHDDLDMMIDSESADQEAE